MEKARLKIFRYDPYYSKEPHFNIFSIPINGERTSVLYGLQYIYENIDSTLAFKYGCRLKRCGLCGVMIDDKPELSCMSFLYPGDNKTIKPLKGFTVLKDLVTDRSIFLKYFRTYSLYIPKKEGWEEKLLVSKDFHTLLSCVNCLRCVSSCPNWPSGKSYNFGGPFIFVKLAQLHLDPRNIIDRKKQALELGIENCLSCKKPCYVITSCNICKIALSVLTP